MGKGVYFCQVKGVTHSNDDGTSRSDAMKVTSVGDGVRLVPDSRNKHDRNAIRVLLQGGQQIGYISARQAARFAGKVHLLTATVHSRGRDEWGNETVKLRVENSKERQTSDARLLAPERTPPLQGAALVTRPLAKVGALIFVASLVAACIAFLNGKGSLGIALLLGAVAGAALYFACRSGAARAQTR